MTKQVVSTFQEFFGDDEVNAVDARELWEKLGSKREFTTWLKTKVLNNEHFQENEDWVLLDNIVKQKGRGGHNQKNYILNIETAKHLAMMENTAIGKKIRKQFINTERKYVKLLKTQLEKAQKTKKIVRKKPPLTIFERAEQLYVHLPKAIHEQIENVAKNQYHTQYYRREWPPVRAEKIDGKITRTSEFAKKEFSWLDQIIFQHGTPQECIQKPQPRLIN